MSAITRAQPSPEIGQRRHLNESQRAMAAAKLATLQQGARTDLSPIGEMSPGDAAMMDIATFKSRYPVQVSGQHPARISEQQTDIRALIADAMEALIALADLIGDNDDRVDRLIARLDEIDGDPDLEPNGDELDSSAGCNDDHDLPFGSVYVRDVRPRRIISHRAKAAAGVP